MGDLNDALNELAGRGTPRGFDDVFAAAERDAARGSLPGVDSSTGNGDDLEPIPLADVEPVARPRRPLHSVIAAAGIAALVLVGGLAVNAAVGSGGGAGSPESAVRKLADAISHEDPLAAADVIAPDEVRSLHDTLSHAEEKAAELQLVETAGAPLAGVDFNVTGLDLSSQSLGDGVAKVTIDAGTFTASTHKAQFSPLLQKALRNSNENTAQSDLATLAHEKNLPTFVVAVRRNGNWYVSATYTVLEYVREANDLPAADFGSGARAVASLGAESPDAAVQDAMRALQRRDWSKLMTLVAPDEIPVYDYRAALTALAQQNDSTGGAGGWFTLDSMTTSAQVAGDNATVTLHAAGHSDSGSWSIDGGCFKATEKESDVGAYSYCDGSEGAYGALFFPFAPLGPNTSISLVKEDGRWFVSPVDTVLDAVNAWIDTLDRRTLYTMIGVPGSLPADGPLVLGQPVTFAPADRGLRILSLDAHKGEVLIGQGGNPFMFGPVPQGSDTGYVYVRVYGPDGSELYDANGILDGQSFTVPADGRYTFAFQNFARGTGTATVWDYADAPASVKQLSPGGRPTCTYGPNDVSCASGGISVPPSGFVTPGTVRPALTPPLSGSSDGGSGVSPGINATICTSEMKANPELQQLCKQLGVSSATLNGGPAPTISVSSGAGSGASGSVSATSVPHG
jgi:hypothetical protein